jgi:class 3 adenylate cyclase
MPLRRLCCAVHRDGIFALFGAPRTTRTIPNAHCWSHCGCNRSCATNRRPCASRATRIEVRIGANTGEVVVCSIRTGDAQAEYTPIGHTTNLESRMQTLADRLDRRNITRGSASGRALGRPRNTSNKHALASGAWGKLVAQRRFTVRCEPLRSVRSQTLVFN